MHHDYDCASFSNYQHNVFLLSFTKVQSDGWLTAGESISPTSVPMSSPQLQVLSRMNEQLASENAALIAELAKVQRRHARQAVQERRQRDTPALVAGVPAKTLEGFLSLSATAAATAPADQSSSTNATARGKEAEQDEKSASVVEGVESTSCAAWSDAHLSLHQRAQQLDVQIELTRLKSGNETLKAEAAEAAAKALNKQDLLQTLQRRLSAAASQHQQEVKQLKRAAKQLETRCEQLALQLPSKTDDSSVQVCPCVVLLCHVLRSCHDAQACRAGHATQTQPQVSIVSKAYIYLSSNLSKFQYTFCAHFIHIVLYLVSTSAYFVAV